MVVKMKIYKNVCELIGRTPMMELSSLAKECKAKARVVAKLESFNPAGSAKDRVGLNIIEDAEKKGLLKPGATIIEPTSGNTGIGLAAVAASKGYKVVLTMPDTMSVERIALIKAYGAEVILTDGAKGIAASVEKAEELKKEIPGSIIAGQFVNPANAEAHFKSTGPEIWEDTDGKVDIFVAGIGTGGTISGTGNYLKSVKPDVKVVGFEPASSPLITEGRAGAHGLQGIGANFIPDAYDRKICDEVMTVTEEEAYFYGRMMARREGVLVGITGGAALAAAIRLSQREENEGKLIVALLPDTGERYMSTEMFKQE